MAGSSIKQLYAELNKLPKPEGVACKSGCAFCCYIPVWCTKEEAEAALDLAEPGPIKHGDFQPCPFLDRRRRVCRVYEHRPLACRQYTSTSRLKCERAHRKRIKDAPIPADGETYLFYRGLARGGELKTLTEWLCRLSG